MVCKEFQPKGIREKERNISICSIGCLLKITLKKIRVSFWTAMTLGNMCHLFSVRPIRRAVSAFPITADQLKPISNPRFLLLSIFHSADCSAKLCKTEHSLWNEKICWILLSTSTPAFLNWDSIVSLERLLLVLPEITFGGNKLYILGDFLHFTMLARWWEILHAIM